MSSRCCLQEMKPSSRVVSRAPKSLSALSRNVLSCRVVSADCRPGRVYFLTLLEPLTGTTGLWPYRQVGQSRNRRQTEPTVDWFTAHAAMTSVF